MANYYAPPPAQRPARRTRPWWWLAAVVIALLAGVVVGRWLSPAASPAGQSSPSGSGAAGLAAAHGPAKITNGVPSGYTHDQTGAATAAANAVQLLVAVAHGQADPDTVRATWIASNAEPETRKVLSAGRTSTGDDQTNKLPASTRVTAYTDTAATVEVWVVSVGSGRSGTATAARWTTVTFQLTWEQQDWKVTRMQSQVGPQPGETGADSPAAPLTNGLYTFYIE